MAEERIELTKKALHRLRAVEAVAEGRLKQGEAAAQLGVTTRQVKRLVAAYWRDGAASRRVGQPSNRRLKEGVREVHGLAVSVETVRGLQIELALWKPMRRKAARAFQLWPQRVVAEVLLPQPRDEQRDLGGGMAVDALKHIDQVVIGVDLMQAAGDDQALHGGDRLGTDLGGTERPIFPIMPSSA